MESIKISSISIIISEPIREKEMDSKDKENPKPETTPNLIFSKTKIIKRTSLLIVTLLQTSEAVN
jgi:hypothetical protein